MRLCRSCKKAIITCCADTVCANGDKWEGEGMIKTCKNCGHDFGTEPCQECFYEPLGWVPKQPVNSAERLILKKETISGVNHNETTTNEQGGKQSRLDYRFDLIDAKALFELAKVMHEGAQKYERDNWRKISAEDHLNHAVSHIFAHLAGDEQDDHLSHALCRCHMALGVYLENNN
jgi:hypothetical protein